MKHALPLIVAILYAVTALAYMRDRQWSWASVWACYALANVCLVFASISTDR